MNLSFELRNDMQREFLNMEQRNICVSGGFGNGKSYIACLKACIFLLTFPKYRHLFARQIYKNLKETTMQTFFKIMPPEFIASHDMTNGVTTLMNGSTVLWMHLDTQDEQSLRGLEINSATIDQAEEITEAMFLVLDARIGRWDKAEVPEHLLTPDWPRDKYGRPRVRNFHDILCNPDAIQHWIYRRFHPDSVERKEKYGYISAATDRNLNDADTIEEIMGRDPEWIAKYFNGEWGASQAQIHFVRKESKILIDDALLEKIINEGSISICLDHGDTSPTVCMWCAAWRGVHIYFKEYYVPNRVISYHRKEIAELCKGMYITARWADPQIFKKTAQKDGGFWSVADEYSTSTLDAPPLNWSPADNNEMATRNRINEHLIPSQRFKHPISGESPAPGIYFALPNPVNGTGVRNAISETEMQRKKLLTTDNGKAIYSDERDDSLVDHAYDTVRYTEAMHMTSRAPIRRPPPQNSLAHYDAILRSRQNRTPVPLSRVQ